MQSKTTRAFRTISEAAEELDLQPHVLRFWESKFPNFRPIKRGGGRRFYRPEDIEFLRGIKILLHDERHPIKDVQKLIRVKGANRVVELGRSIQKAAIEKDVKDTDLVPDRIKTSDGISSINSLEDLDGRSSDFSDETFFPQNEIAEHESKETGSNQVIADGLNIDDEMAEPNIEAAADDSIHEAELMEAELTESETESNEYADSLASERNLPPGRLAGKIYSIDPVPSGLSDAERTDLERALSRLLDLRKQWGVFKGGNGTN